MMIFHARLNILKSFHQHQLVFDYFELVFGKISSPSGSHLLSKALYKGGIYRFLFCQSFYN